MFLAEASIQLVPDATLLLHLVLVVVMVFVLNRTLLKPINDVRFVQALDARGNPVIRVTSTQPVTEPLLTFLVEVDWGQGRLVREYSALVDAPTSVATAPVMPVQAPRCLGSAAIVSIVSDDALNNRS